MHLCCGLMSGFVEIADGVHLWRCPVLDVNATLLVGSRSAALIDTLSTPQQAIELAAGVRAITRLPLTIVNTHDHFDHVFGNATLATMLGVDDIWAHSNTAARLRRPAQQLRAEAAEVCRELAPQIVDSVMEVDVVSPNRMVTDETIMDIGDRELRLWAPGPAHTGGDLVVIDTEVLVAGDLVEESGEPMVGPDADLANWPDVLDALLARAPAKVIPGHGTVVDAGFVARQRDQLAKR